MEAIESWPASTIMAHLRSFFGLADYYQRFIKEYASVVSSLMDLLKKGANWLWSKECMEAFQPQRFGDNNPDTIVAKL